MVHRDRALPGLLVHFVYLVSFFFTNVFLTIIPFLPPSFSPPSLLLPPPSLLPPSLPLQLPYMRHENILCFIAADLVQRGTQMHRHLITVYHERGTLFDYLRKSTLDVCSLITMVHSIANGLTHLHMPLSGDLGQKPGIAHRNLTSKSVIVKNDGEFM